MIDASVRILEDKNFTSNTSLESSDFHYFDINNSCTMSNRWYGLDSDKNGLQTGNKPFLDELIDSRLFDFKIINDVAGPDVTGRMDARTYLASNIIDDSYAFDRFADLCNSFPLRERNCILDKLESDVYDNISYGSFAVNNDVDNNENRFSRSLSDGSSLDYGTVQFIEKNDPIPLNVQLDHHYGNHIMPLTHNDRIVLKKVNEINTNGYSLSSQQCPPHPSAAVCKRKKVTKSKDTDKLDTSKRMKHNEMEKVRRRIVANGFDILAGVLNMKSNRKPSKANILVKARDHVKLVEKNINLLKRTNVNAANERNMLIQRIMNLI